MGQRNGGRTGLAVESRNARNTCNEGATPCPADEATTVETRGARPRPEGLAGGCRFVSGQRCRFSRPHWSRPEPRRLTRRPSRWKRATVSSHACPVRDTLEHLRPGYVDRVISSSHARGFDAMDRFRSHPPGCMLIRNRSRGISGYRAHDRRVGGALRA